MPIGISTATAGLIAGGIGAAGAIGSSIIGSNAASDAAAAQVKAAKLANQTQLDIYNRNSATFKPYVDAGTSALDPLLASYGLKGQAAQQAAIDSFHNAPDYQFSLNQGLTGVAGSAAARGGIYSGGALKALQRYGSDYADTYLNNWRGGLQGIVNTGVGGAQSTAQAGQQYANAYGANTTAAGQARASGYLNSANAVAGGIQDLSTIAAYGAGKYGAGQPSSYNGASSASSGGGATPGYGNGGGYTGPYI